MSNNIDSKYGHDCTTCQGLCCVATGYDKNDDFSMQKDIEIPCKHLDVCNSYKCKIYDVLQDSGFSGCKKFKCFGSGNIVSDIYAKNGLSWDKNPECKEAIFDEFITNKLILEILHKIDSNFSKFHNLNSSERSVLARMKHKLERAIFFYKDDGGVKLTRQEVLDDFMLLMIIMPKFKS